MISRFFIDRPIFAAVLSIVITLAGGIAVINLPIAMYPPIAPPTVTVSCAYPGASAQVVSETVATPIEQQVNGVEDMLYMSSQCTNDGSYSLSVTFKHGVNLNLAQVLVQNRVSLAEPMLPDVLKQTGVVVKKQSPDILMAVALVSPILPGETKARYDQLYLSNYGVLRILDELSRLDGVSEVRVLGQRDYSIRVWVDPEALASRDMTANDIAAAIREQNMQVATGQVGQPPAPKGQPGQVPLSVLGRLTDPEQFEKIIVKTTPTGALVRLKDVARIELGAKSADISSQVNLQPACGMAIFQLPDANALDTAVIVKAKMEELKKGFPAGVDYEIRYDTTPFISESIGEVFKTLKEAIILVAIVVLLFLQNWRSALIPLIAVPVAIIGTFAVMAVFGFNLNNLTLFGLVLAIGIVVDDAIVVVEAVEHHIEHGLKPREATIRAMDEVSGPVIAIGLVLTAVFVPCAFISGIVGQFFRQFALTIAASTIISAFNSLTLSPALAALLLKPRESGKSWALPRVAYAVLGGWFGYQYLAEWAGPRIVAWASRTSIAVDPRLLEWGPTVVAVVLGLVLGWVVAKPVDGLLSGIFWVFNAAFKKLTGVYVGLIGGLLRVSVVVLLLYGGLLYLTQWSFKQVPTGFIPSQDMGYLLANVQMPDSVSLERTEGLMVEAAKLAHKTPGVRFTQIVAGQSLLLSANGPNFGSMFIILDTFEKRRSASHYPEAVVARTKELEKEILDKLVAEDFQAKTTKILDKLIVDRGLKNASEAKKLAARKDAEAVAETLPPRVITEADKVAAHHRAVREAPAKVVEGLTGDGVMASLRKQYAMKLPEAMFTVLGPPPVRGVGRAGGFKLMVEDRGDNGPQVLQQEADRLTQEATNPTIPGSGPKPDTLSAPKVDPNLMAKAEAALKDAPAVSELKGKLVNMTSVFRANVPQVFVEVNRKECFTKLVPLQAVFDTMRIYLGSLYVNDFNRFGRTWQVIIQADQKFRNEVSEVARLKVRNNRGSMIPLGTLADVQERNGPLILTRYNMYPAAPINGAAGLGVSSREAIDLMEYHALNGPNPLIGSMSIEWTELAYLELQAGSTAMIVFGFAVVMVFLVLAAQYESWSLPLAIILVVPMCLLSAVVGVYYSGQDINIFTQIGFVVLVGLASKNAILIVEFAKSRRDDGETRRQSTLDACSLRLRPIIMTSMAFILGVVPLMYSHGAGAEMRKTLGITVFSGMVGVTLFGIILTPVFFFVIDWLGETKLFRSSEVRLVARIALFVLVPIIPLIYLVTYVFREVRRSRRPSAVKPAPKPESHETDLVVVVEEFVEQK